MADAYTGYNAQSATVLGANGYNGKQVWLNYVQEIFQKKVFAKPGINTNGSLSIAVDGQSFVYWTLPADGVKKDSELGKVHATNAGDVRGLRATKVDIMKGEIIDVLIPAAAKLSGAGTVEMLFAQNAVKAANNINECFVAAVEAGAKFIKKADNTFAAVGTDAYKYDETKPLESIVALKAGFNKANAAFGYKPTSLLVSSKVYGDLQAKNLLIYKSLGGTEIYSFLDMDVTECQDLTCDVVMYHRDGVYAAGNLNFIVENANDPAVNPLRRAANTEYDF